MNCIVAVYCLLFTSWVQACLLPFACSRRLGVPESVQFQTADILPNGTQEPYEYLSFDSVPVAECFQGAHGGVAMLSLLIIMFVVFIIPLSIYSMLEKQHKKNMLATLESKTQFGWIYLRYKVELW